MTTTLTEQGKRLLYRQLRQKIPRRIIREEVAALEESIEFSGNSDTKYPERSKRCKKYKGQKKIQNN